VPKKPKKTKEETGSANAAPEAKTSGVAPRRIRASTKKSAPRGKKTATPRGPKGEKSSRTKPRTKPTDEEVRIRAYFIAERRHRLALPGDASADWVEARRQLLVEAGHH
jgi:Protein of unknown function (DUF2934)